MTSNVQVPLTTLEKREGEMYSSRSTFCTLKTSQERVENSFLPTLYIFHTKVETWKCLGCFLIYLLLAVGSFSFSFGQSWSSLRLYALRHSTTHIPICTDVTTLEHFHCVAPWPQRRPQHHHHHHCKLLLFLIYVFRESCEHVQSLCFIIVENFL